MYRSIQDFITDWKTETDLTSQLFSVIPPAQFQVQVHAQVRSLARLAWHLTQTLTEMGHRAGLFTEDHLEGLEIPDEMPELLEIYHQYGVQLHKAVHAKWTDSSLNDEVEMYGESWEKGKVLKVLINHQCHHRGQMTVIMRLLGLPVPGIYGPSREEWLALGMDAPA